MSFVQVKLIAEAFTPTDKTDIGTTPPWTWADIEGVLDAEWEIGGSAMPTYTLRALVAGE
jgi:hypothetical protein